KETNGRMKQEGDEEETTKGQKRKRLFSTDEEAADGDSMIANTGSVKKENESDEKKIKSEED
ncbi:hypothetical protein PMAYCL1PPCAC_26441, partial [Pristionchus mayeri]